MRGFQGTKLIPPTARVAPSTYGAGSESINLQDEFGWGPRNVILSPTFRSQHVIQAANRAWRATSVSPSIQRFVFAWNTIEEQTMSNLRDRISQLEILNDGETIPMPDHRMDD
jgi:hypothetical protein